MTGIASRILKAIFHEDPMFPQDVHKLARAGDPLEPGFHAAAGRRKARLTARQPGLATQFHGTHSAMAGWML